MILLEGKTLSTLEKERIRNEIRKEKGRINLTVILVGEDPSSKVYVSSKEKACQELGIDSRIIRLPESTTTEELINIIKDLNSNNTVNGILVQIPLPGHINEEEVLESIDPSKDVDCLHPYNMGRLLIGKPVVEPCTPKGIIKMLDYFNISIEKKKAVVIGRSNIVGKPIALMLMHRNATVTICHSKTQNLEREIQSADIVVAAIGKPLFVKDSMIKEGTIVIDVGITRMEDKANEKGYRLVGDVDFEAVSKKASAITPVPGGVGAMTIAMLMDNVIRLYRLQKERK